MENNKKESSSQGNWAVFTHRQILSWALYDWANSAFAVAILTAFFPRFYKEFWTTGVEATTSTFQLGVANSLASTVIVITAPILGAIADSGAAKKKFLLVFALLGLSMTGSLYFVSQEAWWLALMLFVLGTIGFSGANVFYDSLLLSVSPKGKLDLVSAYGFALGYLGSGLLFAFDVVMILWPETFGIASSQHAVQIAFLTVAVWWFVFSIPLMLYVPEPGVARSTTAGQAVILGFKQLRQTFAEVRQLRIVFLFLLAYWLYIDGVDTIVRMSVDYGMSLGFDADSLIVAILITQFVGFPAAVGFGFIGQRLGPKKGILIAIAIYILVTIWAFFMDNVNEFYALAITIGLVQGGVQSLSRSLYARLIPANKAAEYFGFYNMLGKFAAILGPLMIGFVGLLTGSPRLSLLSIVVLFVAGAFLLMRVDEEEGIRIAKQLEQSRQA